MIRRFRILAIWLMLLLFHVPTGEAQDAVPAGLRSEFDGHYVAWKRQSEQVQFESSIGTRLQSEHFQAIVKMGPDALPLVAEKCVQDTHFSLNWLGLDIAYGQAERSSRQFVGKRLNQNMVERWC